MPHAMAEQEYVESAICHSLLSLILATFLPGIRGIGDMPFCHVVVLYTRFSMLLFNKRGKPVLEITIWVDVWSRWHFAAKNIIISPAKKTSKLGVRRIIPLCYISPGGEREKRGGWFRWDRAPRWPTVHFKQATAYWDVSIHFRM
jgi:hypothetical protein